ncbi:MAG: T9SS type A sorting domain-containing protein [Bacteroidota bacterium]
MSNPRYIAFSDGKAYVTNWGDGTNSSDDYVAVIDLSNNTVIDTISVIEGPEEIVEKNGTLFVAHQGGFSQGTTVSAIDTSNNSVQSIDVGDVPSALKVDDNNLYVLCSGNPSFTGNETPGSLFIIGLSDYTNIKEFNFPGLEHPAFLGLDATDLYYTLNSNIFKMAISDTELPTVPFIDTATQSVSTPYSFNKINNQLYLGDAIDFVSDGTVFVYGEDGIFDTQYTVGPLPNGFYDTTENSLSLSNFSQPSVKLFPNPTKGSFNIDTNEVVDILIFDISGRVVNRNQYSGQPVSLKGLNPGIYIVQMTINNNKTTQKLILE